MNEKLVSIILPAYNAQMYLPRSIASVQEQTYQNWELLIVDDGSQDDSRAMVQSIAQKDHRVKLLCNQHGGTARARNMALEVAKGAYIAFIDADDAYHPRYLEYLVTAAEREHADLAVCQIHTGVNQETFLVNPLADECAVIDTDRAFAMMYGGQWPLMISPWNKLYASKLFAKNRFPDGRFFEDAATVNLAVYESARICVLDAQLYFYYIAPNSSSKTKRSVELLDREWALRSHWERFLKQGRMDLVYLAMPFYLVELTSIHRRIEESDRPEDCTVIRRQFDRVYREYRRKIKFTAAQRDRIFAFRRPVLYTVRYMIQHDGIFSTFTQLARRRIARIRGKKE